MIMADPTGAVSPESRQANIVTPMCSCGQDLDVYSSKHCPRCGITLHLTHSYAPAA